MAYNKKNRRIAGETLAILVTAHPKTFMPWGTDCVPLKLGIHLDLKIAHPEMPERDLRAALFFYTRTKRYLKALLAIPHRVDLNGEPSGDVSQSHFNNAALEVSKRPDIKLAA